MSMGNVSQLSPVADDPIGLFFTGEIPQRILRFKILLRKAFQFSPVLDTPMPVTMRFMAGQANDICGRQFSLKRRYTMHLVLLYTRYQPRGSCRKRRARANLAEVPGC